MLHFKSEDDICVLKSLFYNHVMVEFGKVLEKSVKMHIKYFIAFANPDLQSLTNVW